MSNFPNIVSKSCIMRSMSRDPNPRLGKTMRTLGVITIGLATLLALLVPAGALAVAAPAKQACPRGWGSLVETKSNLSGSPIVGVRTGRHTCFDRIVFDVRGSAPGYTVQYITPPFTGIGGEPPFVVGGGAILGITVNAPAYDQGYNATLPYNGGQVIVRPDQFDARGFRTFEDLVYGGSFEGYTSFGLGVRARLPFKVMVLPGPGANSRVVVDVAHRW